MSELRKMYHTQEKRKVVLTSPIECTRDDAWLGNAYYFWDDYEDAKYWGEKGKRKTGAYQVYVSNINCDNILDTVFNEEHYKFWLKQVEKAAITIIKKTNTKPTIKEINNYFKEKANWKEDLSGILFQDLPTNQNFLLVLSFYYRKRIQLAVYKLESILSFELQSEHVCS